MCSTGIFAKLSSRPSAFSIFHLCTGGCILKLLSEPFSSYKKWLHSVVDDLTIAAKISQKEREASPGLRNPGTSPIQKKSIAYL